MALCRRHSAAIRLVRRLQLSQTAPAPPAAPAWTVLRRHLSAAQPPPDAPDFLAELESRSLLQAHTGDRRALQATLAQRPAVYCGFDPTAPSLHVGSLLALLCLARAQNAGLAAVALVGGATAQIGDPSGRSSERPQLQPEALQRNTAGIAECVQRVLDHAASRQQQQQQEREREREREGEQQGQQAGGGAVRGGLRVVDNSEWYSGMSAVELVCGIGRHFRLQPMLARDSVRSRLQAEGGLSFTEFAYQVFQAYDFYHLYTTQNCRVQLGGSDQWGNITAGTDLIRRLAGKEDHLAQEGLPPDAEGSSSGGGGVNSSSSGSGSESAAARAGKEAAADAAAGAANDNDAFGITLPLLTTKSGAKFGKSAGNAIWLSADMTSPYELYQYLLQTADDEVRSRLLQLTLLTPEDVEDTMEAHRAEPAARTAQRALAREVVFLAHGEEGVREAELCTSLLHSDAPVAAFGAAELEAIWDKVPHCSVELGWLASEPTVADLLVHIHMAPSKKRARKLIADGGVMLNDQTQLEATRVISRDDDFLPGNFTVVRVGKKRTVVRWWSP